MLIGEFALKVDRSWGVFWELCSEVLILSISNNPAKAFLSAQHTLIIDQSCIDHHVNKNPSSMVLCELVKKFDFISQIHIGVVEASVCWDSIPIKVWRDWAESKSPLMEFEERVTFKIKGDFNIVILLSIGTNVVSFTIIDNSLLIVRLCEQNNRKKNDA